MTDAPITGIPAIAAEHVGMLPTHPQPCGAPAAPVCTCPGAPEWVLEAGRPGEPGRVTSVHRELTTAYARWIGQILAYGPPHMVAAHPCGDARAEHPSGHWTTLTRHHTSG